MELMGPIETRYCIVFYKLTPENTFDLAHLKDFLVKDGDAVGWTPVVVIHRSLLDNICIPPDGPE